MSIFGDIMSAIFGRSAKAETPAAGTQAPAAPAGSPAAAPTAAAPSAGGAPAASAAPAATVDVAAVLDALAKKNKQKLNWRTSIVDLMKLLDLELEPDRAQEARRGAALLRRHQGLGEDERLAAQAGDDQARRQWRQGARRSEGLAAAFFLAPCWRGPLFRAVTRTTPLPLGRGRRVRSTRRVRGL